MALTGKPAIASPNQLDLRALQTAISNTRQRIEQLEAAVNNASSSSSSSTVIPAQIAQLQSQLSVLQAIVAALSGSGLIATLLLAADGIVVKASGTLITRALAEGAGIAITDPSGVGADPTIALDILSLPIQSGTPTGAEEVPVSLLDGTIIRVTTQQIADLNGGGGGGITDLTGDVTASGSGSVVATIAAGVVTYAKIQNVSATSRVLLRKTAGAGSVEEGTLSDLLDFIGSAAQGDILYRGASTWARLGAGTSGQFLKTLGTGADPTWATASGSPGGSTTQVQFNDAGAFGGDADFTWDKTGNTLTIGTTGTPATIAGGAGSAAAGAALTIIGGTGGATNNAGGAVTLQSGAGAGSSNGGVSLVKGGTGGATGNGGAVQITGGTAGATSGVGGAVTIAGGSVPISGGGGSVTITGSNATSSGGGGALTLTAGNGANTGVAGAVTITAGTSGGAGGIAGGAVSINGGNSGNGTGGAVNITAGAGQSGFGGGGANLTGGTGQGGGGGGAATVTGGTAGATGNGGAASVVGGTPIAGAGGAVNITGAAGVGTNKAGGNVVIRPGAATGSGNPGNIQLDGGSGAALATTAIGGFVTLPTCAGTPTGVPVNVPTGSVAAVVDSTNSIWYAYIGGAWKGFQPLDSDLTTIAGLTATTDNFIQSKSSAWTSRTVAQVTTDLQGTGLVAGSVGFREVPPNSQSANYTTVAADAGKSIDHPASDANARTFTIDSNANVAYPDGTCITFTNMTSQILTIAITSDTMYLAGTGATGSRSLAQYGIATARKLTSTTWLISGTNLS